MLDVTIAAWAVTVGLVLVLLAIDFALAVARPHEVGFREATLWSVFYIAVAIGFGLVFASFAGWGYGGEYFAGYIVEKSLSVDNLFVFVVIMTSFAVPAEHQQKVLVVGIILALILRVIFIALGAALLEAFSFMFLLFGLLLVFTAIQLFRHRDQDPEVEDNALVRFAQRRLPVTEDYDGGKLVTHREGRRMLTPLFLVLLAIGSTDILFALDSIPAVFGVTEETFIVFTRERLRAAGAARAVLPGHRPARPARLPLNRTRAHPRIHRSQTRAALGPPPGRRRAGDLHRHVARRHRGRPHRHDDRQPAQGAPRPGCAGARRVAARAPAAPARLTAPRRSQAAAVSKLVPCRPRSTTASISSCEAASSTKPRAPPAIACAASPVVARPHDETWSRSGRRGDGVRRRRRSRRAQASARRRPRRRARAT